MSDPTLSPPTPAVNSKPGPRRSPRLEDLSGQRFGRLVAREFVGRRRWRCDCDCGRSCLVRADYMKSGTTGSCGCAHYLGTHGKARHPLYHLWLNMIQRCYNPKCHAYHLYGGRGIKVCDRWKSDPSAFFADVEPRPSPGHTIDRMDTNGDYGPGNWRWATSVQQGRNRRSNRLIEFRGESKCLADWAEQFGLLAKTVGKRLDGGWGIERALLTPVGLSSSRLRAEQAVARLERDYGYGDLAVDEDALTAGGE